MSDVFNQITPTLFIFMCTLQIVEQQLLSLQGMPPTFAGQRCLREEEDKGIKLPRKMAFL